MKKLIPLMILTGAISGFSQGIVQFQNSVTFLTPDPGPNGAAGLRLVYGVGSPLNTVSGAPLVGTQWVAELYSGPQGANEASLTPIVSTISHFRATTTVNKGKWTAGANNSQVDLGVAAGTHVTLQVKVWDSTAFSTFELAKAGGGITGSCANVFDFVAADPSGLPSTFLMEGMQSFALVPEPSAIALGVMGIAGLLLVRRRK